MRARDVEGAAGNAVRGFARQVLIDIARTGQHEEHLVLAHLLFHETEAFRQLTVQTDVGVLHLQRTLIHSLAQIVAGIVGQREEVGNVIHPQGSLLQAVAGKTIHFIVDQHTLLQVTHLAFPREGVFEETLYLIRHEVMGRGGEGGFPFEGRDTLLQSVRTVIVGQCPLRKHSVVVGTAPLSRKVINPKGEVGRMTGREDGSITIGRDAIHQCLSLGGHLEFIGQRADGQTGGTALFGGEKSHAGLVIHAVMRL